MGCGVSSGNKVSNATVSHLSKLAGAAQVIVNPEVIANIDLNRGKIFEAQVKMKMEMLRMKAAKEKGPPPTLSEEIRDLMLQIRQESFNRMRTWDESRSELMGRRRVLIDSVSEKLESNLKLFLKGLEDLTNFLQLKAKQENEYAQTSHQKLEILSTLFQNGDQHMLPDLSETFKKMDAMHRNKADCIIKFSEFLKKNLVDSLLLPQQTDFKKELTKIREKVEGLKKTLSSATSKTKEEYERYNKFFQSTQKNFSTPTANVTLEKDDLHSLQLYIVEVCKKEAEALKALGKGIVELWREVVSKDGKVIEALMKAMKEYQERYIEVHGENVEHQDKSKITGLLTMGAEKLKDTAVGFVPGLGAAMELADTVDQVSKAIGSGDPHRPEIHKSSPFRVEKILNSEEVTLVRNELQKFGDDPLEIKDFDTLFDKLDITINLGDTNTLIKQNLNIKRDVAKITKDFQVCPCHITVDYNILVMDHIEGKSIEDYCFNMYHSSLIPRNQKNRFLFDFVEKIPGLFSSNKKILLDLESEEKTKEFQELLGLSTAAAAEEKIEVVEEEKNEQNEP